MNQMVPYDPYEPMYQILINKFHQIGLDNFKDPKTLIEYSKQENDVYPNIVDDSNPNEKT